MIQLAFSSSWKSQDLRFAPIIRDLCIFKCIHSPVIEAGISTGDRRQVKGLYCTCTFYWSYSNICWDAARVTYFSEISNILDDRKINLPVDDGTLIRHTTNIPRGIHLEMYILNLELYTRGLKCSVKYSAPHIITVIVFQVHVLIIICP